MFRILYGSLEEWVVISPKGGARLVFERDTGRCDSFPFVYLDDPAKQAFFDVTRGEPRVERKFVSEHFPSRNHTGRIITKSGQKGG